MSAIDTACALLFAVGMFCLVSFGCVFIIARLYDKL